MYIHRRTSVKHAGDLQAEAIIIYCDTSNSSGGAAKRNLQYSGLRQGPALLRLSKAALRGMVGRLCQSWRGL